MGDYTYAPAMFAPFMVSGGLTATVGAGLSAVIDELDQAIDEAIPVPNS
jgi:hypothetical protein